MYYTIYKITNKINDKIYIGLHRTLVLEDNYFGSGKILKEAIKKYGKKNFMKEILFVFDNEKEMIEKERELVVISKNSYNLCPGGVGGNLSIRKGKSYVEIYGDKVKDICNKMSESKLGNKNPMYGKTHSEESKRKISTNGYLRNMPDIVRKKAMETRSKNFKSGETKPSMYGKTHSEESKRKISESVKGNTNNKNKIWINDTFLKNRMIPSNSEIPNGWIKGRLTR